MQFRHYQEAQAAYRSATDKMFSDARHRLDPLSAAVDAARLECNRLWRLETMAVEVTAEGFKIHTGYYYVNGERGGSDCLPDPRDILATAALRHVHRLWMAGDLADLPPSGDFVDVVAWCAKHGVRNLQRAGF